MPTTHTLYIRLEGENEERQIKVGPGQQLLIRVDDTLEVKKLHISEDIFVRYQKEKVSNYKLVTSLVSELEETKKKLKVYQDYFVSVERLKPELICQELAPQQTDADSLTASDRACFNPLCRVALIKRELKDYVSTHKWLQGYWVVVHKIFQDLHWWTGKDTEFIDWVEKLGYKLTENNFKKVKRETKECLAQWYAPSSTNRYAVVARELYDIFTGGPRLPKVATFESSHINHADLTIRINKATISGIRNHRVRYTKIDTPRHADYVARMGQKRNLIIPSASLGIPMWRHENIGTLGMIDTIKPGRRRCRPSSSALSHREAITHI
ncbi:MAG: hypothetical protein IKY64_03220 [Bacteroidaceae bacterium]|nr:hypothetical protein [Bacteroidaceae bacterium]